MNYLHQTLNRISIANVLKTPYPAFAKSRFLLLFFVCLINITAFSAGQREDVLMPYDGPSVSGADASTLKGKVMTGYQGWFNCPDDGAKLRWTHWAKDLGKPFQPGNIAVDLWPDVSEYDDDELYTPLFHYEDGTAAKTFSSHNRKTVVRHFKWMRDYGIDGAFVQRFANGLKDKTLRYHKDKVLSSAREGANRYGRTYTIMYDLTGIPDDYIVKVFDDWRMLRDKMKITEDPAYQHHNGKPVVGIWGVGFNGQIKKRPDFKECTKLLKKFNADGCSVMLGTATGWRAQDKDATQDPDLHAVLLMADVISPWSVGRFGTLAGAKKHAEKYWQQDVAWAREHGIDYMPVVFPGFSWHNLRGVKMNSIPRLKGEFLWSQIVANKKAGADMIYVAMFDEVDEATAIFKCTDKPPTSDGVEFLTMDGLSSDFYLRLVGEAGKLLRDEIPLTETVPVAAKQSSSSKHGVEVIEPASLDLTKPTLFIMPYTHLDDVWRWSYPQTIRDFLKNTLDDNFEAFEEYPHYMLNWSGASRYDMMREYYPEKYEELKKWVAAGRWFPSGSSWVENDTNVPSTESIIRQILLGREYFYNEFGKESLEYMLPDCFGFPYSLPSVLSHCGLRGFSTQKLTWESANGIPFNLGRWVGPDGESIIASLNCGNYARRHTDVYTTHEPTLKRLEENRKETGLAIDLYYMGGGDEQNNSDRGGRPQSYSLETLEKCYATQGPVKVIAARSDTMVRAITDEQAEKFPTWEKDLLLIKHSTGVLTSQSYMKQLNRDAELLADAGERAAVSANLVTGAAYPADTLNHAWGLTLRNQFHDTLPGTSLPKAYEYAWNDGIISLNQFDGVYKDAVGSLARSLDTDVPGVPLVVYNPLSIAREDLVEALVPAELADAKEITAFNAQGRKLPTQLTTGWDGKRRVLFSAKLPPVGAAVYSLRKGKPSNVKKSELRVERDLLENDCYKVKIDINGDIASIFDKRIGKELFEQPAQLEFIANFPEQKPAWRIYWKDIKEPARSVAANPVSIRVVEKGPLRIAIEVVRENEGSKIAQRIRLSAGIDGSRVEVANHFDWKSRGVLLKAAFHLTASAPEATYNLDLGTIQRGNSHEKQYEVPGHAWIDLTDSSGSYGVSLLTGSKYGSDKPDDNTLRLTLLHSPDTFEWEDETLDRGKMREMRWQDWGRHEFKYAIAGHKGDWRDDQTHWQGQRFDQRPAAFVVPRYKGNKASSFTLLNIDTSQVNVQAVKMAENGSGVVVRMQELSGRPCKDATLSTVIPITAAEELDGAERPLDKKLAIQNGKLKFDFTPYELKTVLLKIHGAKTKAVTQPVTLKYDTDIFSYNNNREDGYLDKNGIDGSFDGKGSTYPAEMIGDTVEMGNVTFAIGPRKDGVHNSVACRGQIIDLPTGTMVLHILAAADVDTDAVFRAGETEFPLTVGGWSGYIGSWDNREFEGFVAELSYSLRNDLKSIAPAFIRDQRIAWCASHRHLPAADTLYEYGYMFAYRLEIPKGASSMTLPNSPFVRIVAMSVGDEGSADALRSPFEDLHRDRQFRNRFDKLMTTKK